MSNVFDFVNSISFNKKDLLKEGEHSSGDYVPFIVNKALSNFPDTVLYANEMNVRHTLDTDQQYHYLLHTIRPAKRWAGKWAKTVTNEDLEAIKLYYDLNNQKAQIALSILSKEQIDTIRKRVQHGGVEQRSKK